MGNIRNLIGAGLVAAGIFISWAWTLPSYQAASALKTVLEEKQLELTKKQEIIEKIRDWKREYDQRADDIAEFQKIIPNKKKIEEIVIVLEQVTSQSGLQMLTMEVTEQKSLAAAAYDPVAFNVSLRGGYESLKVFLSQIEKNIRLLDVISLEVVRSNEQVAGAPTLLNIRLRMNAYTAREAAAASQQARPAGED